MKADEWFDRTDAELVAESVQGCLAAFDELVRRFRPAVRLTVRRYACDGEEIEDLCQEAFFRAFKALPRLEQPERIGAWLHAIARNLALRERQYSARRRERFSLVDPPALEESAATEPSPAEEFDLCEAHRLIREAVDTLPAPYRAVVYLHYWEQMPLSRVAAYLNVPLSTAKWRLRYARERLRRELADMGAEDEERGEP